MLDWSLWCLQGLTIQEQVECFHELGLQLLIGKDVVAHDECGDDLVLEVEVRDVLATITKIKSQRQAMQAVEITLAG